MILTYGGILATHLSMILLCWHLKASWTTRPENLNLAQQAKGKKGMLSVQTLLPNWRLLPSICLLKCSKEHVCWCFRTSTKFIRFAHYANHCIGRVNVILWTPRVCTNSTQDIWTIAPKAICYMDHTSIHIRVNIFGNTQRSCDWKKTHTTASRGLTVISSKPGVSTNRTSDLRPIASKVIWYMDHNSTYMRVEIFEIGQSSCDTQTA